MESISEDKIIFQITEDWVQKESNEAPNRSRAAGYLMTPCSTEVAVGMPCPSRSRAAEYND
jgi:hypothetical protein